MSVQVAVWALLLDDTDVTGLVSTRIKPKLPQGSVLPAITYQKISAGQDPLIDYAYPRMQVTAWGETLESAREVADAVRYCLQRYKGTVGAVRITQITFMNDLDLHDPVTGYETVPADYQVNYWEE